MWPRSIKELVLLSLLNSLSVDYIIPSGGMEMLVDAENLPKDIWKLFVKAYQKLTKKISTKVGPRDLAIVNISKEGKDNRGTKYSDEINYNMSKAIDLLI